MEEIYEHNSAKMNKVIFTIMLEEINLLRTELSLPAKTLADYQQRITDMYNPEHEDYIEE